MSLDQPTSASADVPDGLAPGEVGDHLADDDLDGLEPIPAAGARSEPTEHERLGGSRREFAILTLVAGLAGLWASIRLTLDYFATLADPNFTPACDINPLIGCGVFLASEQSSAFGFPNVVIGLVAFPVVITTGVLLLGGLRLPRWYWRGFFAGTVFAIGFVTWLQVQALTQIGALCPYCLVVWAAIIPLFVHTTARSVQNGALPGGPGLRSFLVGNRWIITALWYLIVIAAAVLAFGEKWLLVF
ncbi:vitamin K epoxide reductase family protein [Occultella glacieicola]|uniref:Vitamin K epoxide reductase family protein n=1 Tax=Occultella glacieicola TaxID=2518684 RepID=A0ABY2DYR3_9MICO|nr:vitamin K epoxide reductase family protein [Occultella glacieicola]TDE89623.1 vitamin K epoxide reductase family protein [Occultella glacieicola]